MSDSRLVERLRRGALAAHAGSSGKRCSVIARTYTAGGSSGATPLKTRTRGHGAQPTSRPPVCKSGPLGIRQRRPTLMPPLAGSAKQKHSLSSSDASRALRVAKRRHRSVRTFTLTSQRRSRLVVITTAQYRHAVSCRSGGSNGISHRFGEIVRCRVACDRQAAGLTLDHASYGWR